MGKLQPKLRFPEFKEDWKQSTISNEFSIFNGYAFKSIDSSLEGVRWIKIADVDINKISNDNISYLPDSYLNKYDKFSLKKGDYVIALTRPILNNRLKIAKIDDSSNNSLLNQRVGKIISNNNLDYVYYYLQRNKIINLINDKIAGNDPPNLSPQEINSIEFSTPTLQEQTKIADFLGAVDKQLDILNQKKEKLNTYKKGVMQQLFAQQLRFKDNNGNNYPDWQEKNINDVFSFRQGIQCELNQQYLIKNENQYRFIRIIDLTNENEPPRYIYHENTNDIINETDLFMVRYGTPGLVGYGYRGIIANNLFRLIPNQKVNNLFYKYQFDFLNKEIISLSSSTSMPAISFKSLNKLKVAIPSIKEQTKIANFLSAIDNQIEAIENQITKTETYKKGLLQQMFV